MIQLAGALQAIGRKHMKDGIHSTARPLSSRVINISWLSTPGRGSTTQCVVNRFVMSSVFSKLMICCELKMSPRDSSEGLSTQRQSDMRPEFATIPLQPCLWFSIRSCMLRETISLVARSSFKSMLNSGRRLSPGGVRDSWPKPVGDAAKSKPLSPHAASTVVVQDSRKRTIFDALFFFSGPKKSRYTCTVKIDQAPIVTITRTALVSRCIAPWQHQWRSLLCHQLTEHYSHFEPNT